MKAFIPTGDPAEPVRLAEVPPPSPRPNEALVKVQAYSINRGETFKLIDLRERRIRGKAVLTVADSEHVAAALLPDRDARAPRPITEETNQ
jgi:hypothetical protein